MLQAPDARMSICRSPTPKCPWRQRRERDRPGAPPPPPSPGAPSLRAACSTFCHEGLRTPRRRHSPRQKAFKEMHGACYNRLECSSAIRPRTVLNRFGRQFCRVARQIFGGWFSDDHACGGNTSPGASWAQLTADEQAEVGRPLPLRQRCDDHQSQARIAPNTSPQPDHNAKRWKRIRVWRTTAAITTARLRARLLSATFSITSYPRQRRQNRFGARPLLPPRCAKVPTWPALITRAALSCRFFHPRRDQWVEHFQNCRGVVSSAAAARPSLTRH